ncbi:SDR family NAD(P)-dependent oxidoreductase [Mycobacterium sp. 236(2023)]|uniref:SDR family NAD(P)-dependent oxidoreductase n=1 Tax=Mycobacterium sp. 236(2023) TaxID=3038163 RepID=UPI00241522D9|nr:SDR family NAD(P)-dependent oxidoreductase [Mycobacterium sp. 236(2023)]MDG4668036.1 SDR family NAD(P)-dependent oxidoreductase [Mycobacterium sp. 236(2023)]
MSALAVVTGASSGIGKAFTERLAADGYELITVGRDLDRLQRLADTLPVDVTPVAADLATHDGIATVIEGVADRAVDLLVNNAGVAHYMPFSQLPEERANELLFVKVIAPTLLARAVAPGMVDRRAGTIINVAGMLAYSGPAPLEQLPLRRAVYVGANAHLVAFSETLAAELAADGIAVQALCPGVVATEFHQRQGIDMSGAPRMSPHDVVTASLRALELGEVICAPSVEDHDLLEAVADADLAAFGAQSVQLATRYRP